MSPSSGLSVVEKTRPIDKLTRLLESPDEARDYHAMNENDCAMLLAVLCEEYVMYQERCFCFFFFAICQTESQPFGLV